MNAASVNSYEHNSPADYSQYHMFQNIDWRRSECILMEWFLHWAETNDMKRFKTTNYFWLQYKRAARENKMSIITVQKAVKSLVERGVLFRHIIKKQNGTEIYLAFNALKMNEIIIPDYKNKRKEYLEKIMTSDPFIETPIVLLPPSNKPISEPVQRILEKLQQLRHDPANPKSPKLFKFKMAHEHGGKWTKQLYAVEKNLLDIYAGKVHFHEWAPPEFMEAHKSNKHLINEQTREKLNAAKGSWEAVEKLVLDAAANFRLWFDPQYEPQGKDWLEGYNLQTWMRGEYKPGSLFLACINRPPYRIQETFADNVYESLPEEVAEIASEFKKPGWDNFKYWCAVKSVVNWYRANAVEIVKNDTNAQYWFDGGVGKWFGRYVRYLDELGNVAGHQVGTGNNTWRSFVRRAGQTHDLRYDLTEL